MELKTPCSYDGQIENGQRIVGQVGLDGHVFESPPGDSKVQ